MSRFHTTCRRRSGSPDHAGTRSQRSSSASAMPFASAAARTTSTRLEHDRRQLERRGVEPRACRTRCARRRAGRRSAAPATRALRAMAASPRSRPVARSARVGAAASRPAEDRRSAACAARARAWRGTRPSRGSPPRPGGAPRARQEELLALLLVPLSRRDVLHEHHEVVDHAVRARKTAHVDRRVDRHAVASDEARLAARAFVRCRASAIFVCARATTPDPVDAAGARTSRARASRRRA